ncbi:MAG TPA: sorbosone dehydrogenase family protein [Terriglobales bacterium]|nr:sorbosone dehydrogenase family protein [Terriglobales bacterium]
MKPVLFSLLVFLFVPACFAVDPSQPQILTGQSAFTGWEHEAPGTFRKLTVADLPKPYATKSVDNGPDIVPRPADAWPQALPGYKVELYASRLENPRRLTTAPNGDIFLAESSAGKIKVLRGVDQNGKAQQVKVFASGLHQPFGIAFYPLGPNPQWVYVGDTDAVVRFPYQNGDLKARGAKQHIADLPGGGHLRGGGHWTRDIAFSLDGRQMFVSVGSHSNADDPDTHPEEKDRADVLVFNPDGSGKRIYASGIRNAVGIAINPETGELWGSVNERDDLGDNLVPDYITHFADGGFYGWPWYYIGKNQDPRLPNSHPDLLARMITPDVLLQPHFASLEMAFYEASQFPAEYKGDIFAAEHGSWNRAPRAGYEVIRVPLHQAGHASGDYEDFLTGFVTRDGKVWGRPVGVTVGKDGALYVSDDGSRSIWRVEYVGNANAPGN